MNEKKIGAQFGGKFPREGKSTVRRKYASS
jgi:hypothetical protein